MPIKKEVSDCVDFNKGRKIDDENDGDGSVQINHSEVLYGSCPKYRYKRHYSYQSMYCKFYYNTNICYF